MSEFYRVHAKMIRFVLIAVLLFAAFKYLFPIFSPLLVSFLVSLLLHPVIGYLAERTKLPKGFWAFLLLLLVTIFVLSVFGGILYFAGRQGVLFFRDSEDTLNLIYDRLDGCCCLLEKKFCLKSGCLLDMLQRLFARLRKILIEDKLADLLGGSLSVAKSLAKAGAYLVVFYVAAALLLKEMDQVSLFLKSRLGDFPAKAGRGVWIYLSAQLKLMSVISAVCFLCFCITGKSGKLLLAFITAFLDMLPFIGTGIILIPLLLYHLLLAEYIKAGILLATYVLCIVLRQYLEPKLIGKKIGISPFLTLTGIYAGVKLFSVRGIFLGPIYVLVLTVVYRRLFGKVSSDLGENHE